MIPLKRHVRWQDLGAEMNGWHLIRVDAEGAPDRYLHWVEASLGGPWTFRTMSEKDVQSAFGRPSAGNFFLEFAFRDVADADLFETMLGAPAGRA